MLHENGKNQIALSEIPDILNEFFDLDDDDRVDANLPNMWWYRSRNNRDIMSPMPEPKLVVRVGSREHPQWEQATILHWFGEWKELEVPVCVEAGDKVDKLGRVTKHRDRRVG